MIKATIQNAPYCTEMTFPCTETELQEKLGDLKINKEHLAPTGMIIDIEPSKLSTLLDCEVSLDALNYLGKRMDGMEGGFQIGCGFPIGSGCLIGFGSMMMTAGIGKITVIGMTMESGKITANGSFTVISIPFQ